jgi:gliding motility-associated-like protein
MKNFTLLKKRLVVKIGIGQIFFLLLFFAMSSENQAMNEYKDFVLTKNTTNLVATPIPPEITGIVWEDINGNGQQDDGATWISGVNVDLLDGTGGFLQSTTTDGSGTYLFDNLAVGNYIIRFNLNGAYEYTHFLEGPAATDSDADPSNNGESNSVNLLAGQTITDIDAGFYLPATIGDFVWEDLNGNGEQDGGEPGIPGVDVTLDGSDGAGNPITPVTVTTNGAGWYNITDVMPGNYFLTFAAPAAYLGTAMDMTSDDLDSDADPSNNGETVFFDVFSDDILEQWDAGFFLPASVSNLVWEDLNGNGIQDGNGPGIAGVDVTLDGTTGAGAAYTDSDVTDGNGEYLIENIPPGNYRIEVTIPADYFATFQDNGADNSDSDIDDLGNTAYFDLISDQENEDMDAGMWQYASIGDFVWEDLNGDGIQDGGEPGVAGATVDITGTEGDGDAYSSSVNTDGAGMYLFSDLEPGTYTLTFNLAGGYDEFTLQDQGADDTDSDADPASGVTIAYDLESDEDYTEFDAGMYAWVRVGDFCWLDENGNGIQDGEPGLGNVEVRAIRTSDGLGFQTFSDATGFYEFNELPPGEYFFIFSLGGYEITWMDQTGDDSDSDPDPTTGQTANYDFESADEDLSIDAGFFQFGVIGDYTWRDQNTDGVQDAGENPFPFIDINLTGTTGHGAPVTGNTTSDGAGFYQFIEVPPGEYQLEFITPASYAESPFQAAGDPELDSDAPVSDIFTIESGQMENSIDAGYYVEPPDDCDQQPANECTEAEILCDIEDIHDFCTVMLEPWNPNVPDPLCPTGGFSHNPSWFAFVASAETVTLIIHASDCSVGGGQQIGIQYGIYNACGPPWNPVICQPNCELPGDITVTSSNFTPGEDYFFFIDGCNGTICTYWIEIVEGGGFYEVTDPTGISCDEDDGDCENVCLGQTVEFTLDETDNAVDYIWTIDGVQDESLDAQIIDITFLEEGTFTLCGHGENVCDISDEVCIEVTVTAEPDVDLGVFEVCANVLADPGFEPDDWAGGVITAPGAYTTETENEFGCLFNQLVEIVEIPNEIAEVDTFACIGETITFLGEDFSNNVIDYDMVDVGGSANGCDRFVKFTAQFMSVDYASFDDIICLGSSNFELSLFELATYPENPEVVSVQWYLDGSPIQGPFFTFPFTIQVTDEGVYTAEVFIQMGDQICSFIIDDEVELFFDELLPDEPEQNTWQLEYCNNVNDTLPYAVFNPDFNYTYVWSYPNDVNYAYYDEDLATLFIDWFGSDGGEICVQAINECGESTVYCEYIFINPGPNAEFVAPDTLCLTDLTEIEYTGTADDDANYTWTFSGGVDTSGNNDQGAGPYVLTWASAGPKVVSLVVEENGCVSDLEQHTIVLDPPLQTPFVSCNSNQSEITFSWNDLANAEGYDVELIMGDAGTFLGTSYFVDGLDPLDSVSIVVTALSANYCPPTMTDTITCYALDCPDVTVDILVEDTSICYSGGGSAFILDHLITPDDLGPITWSGPGIIDENTGLFHPDSAGFGSHDIIVNYVVDNCTFNDLATINIYEEPTAEFTVSEDTICNTGNLVVNYTGNMPDGNATWEFSNPSNLTGTDLNQHVATWDVGGPKTISLQVEQNGCVSALESKIILVEEQLPDIDIDCATSVDSIVFSWDGYDGALDNFEIYIDGNLESTSLDTTWTVDGLSEGDEIEIYIVGLNPGVCANPTGIQECEAEACPIFTIDVTPALDSICLVEGISPIQLDPNLTGMTTTGVEIWTGDGVDPNTGMFDPALAGVGTHTITYAYTEGSCDIDTSFEVTVLEQPVADFSVDQNTICITDAITLTNNEFNPNFDYTWSFDGANSNQISDEVYELNWDDAGAYTLTLQANNFMCESELVTQDVTVEPELVAPTVSCDPTTMSIGLNWTAVDCASAYQIFADGELLTETTDLNYMIGGLNSSQEVNIEIVVVSECACPNISTTLDCSTLDCEDIELSIEELQTDLSYCADEAPASINLHASIEGSQGGEIGWSGNFITASGDAGNVQLDQLEPGQHYFTLTYELDNCYYEFTDYLTIYPAVEMLSNFSDPSCHDMTNGRIEINPSEGTAPYNYFMSGVQQDSNIIESLAAGTYDLEVIDVNGCNTQGQVVLNNPPLIEPSITGLDVLQENTSGTYTLGLVSTPADAEISWYFSGGDTLCNSNCGNTVDISIEDQVDICADIYYNGGQCLESDCFTVRFEEIVDVYIPNVFSPNNDDHNDVFYIKTDESVSLIKSMSIFDRWGELIYHNTNFAPNEADLGWDGTFNGKSLLPGVYVYDIVVVSTEDKDYRYSGDITLIR